MAKYTELTNTRPIVDKSGVLTQEARQFFNTLSSAPVLIGSGSPEGVIEANQGALYVDIDATTGSILYVKKQGSISSDVSQGWVLV